MSGHRGIRPSQELVDLFKELEIETLSVPKVTIPPKNNGQYRDVERVNREQ